MQNIRFKETSVTRREPRIQKELQPQIRRFRVVALDLDGTLLRRDHQISIESVKYLRHLHSRGIQIVLATGRAAPNVYEHVKRLNLPQQLPVICSNGSKGLLCQPGPNNGDLAIQELFSIPVPLNVVERTMQLARRLHHVVQYYYEDSIFANPSKFQHYSLAQRYTDLTGSKTIFVKDRFESLLQMQKLPSKLLMLCPEDELDNAMKAFREEFAPDEATLVYGTTDTSRGWFLEILHPDICKGRGLELMCDALQCSTDDCVAFGDGHNDLEFVEMAGKGIVMKNGQDAVKKIADEITDYTNNEDGVIRTLQRMEKDGSLKLSLILDL